MRRIILSALTIVFLFAGNAWGTVNIYWGSTLYRSINKSAVTPITLTVLLDRPAPAGGVVVDIGESSATSTTDLLSPAQSDLNDFGLKKDYTLSSRTLTFAAREQAKTFTFTAANNTTVNLDKRLVLTLLTSTPGAQVAQGGAKLTIKIVDNERTGIVNAVTEGLANDGSDISAALTTLLGTIGTNSKKVLYFPAGTYAFSDVTFPWGLTCVGVGESQTILKRKPGFASRGYPNWEEVVIIDTTYSGASDSSPLAFSNLTIHGDDAKYTIKIDLTPAGQTNFGGNETFLLKPYETQENKTITFTSGATAGLNVHIDDANRPQMTADLKAVILANWTGVTIEDIDTTSFYLRYGDGTGATTESYIYMGSTNLAGTEMSATNNEQSSLMRCGGANPANTGKFSLRFSNTTIGYNGCSGGINVTGQTALDMFNITGIGKMPYHTAGMTGGFSTYRMKNLTAWSIHTEHGYDGNVSDPNRMDLYIENCTLGRFVCGMSGSEGESANSTTYLKNTTVSESFQFSGVTGSLPSGDDNYQFIGCDLTMYEQTGVSGSGLIQYPGKATFTDCIFRLSSKTTTTEGCAAKISWFTGVHNQWVKFVNCDFYVTGTPAVTRKWGVGLNTSNNDIDTYNDIIELTNCRFNSAFHACFGCGNGSGGFYKATNCTYNGTYVFRQASSTDANNWRVEITGASSVFNVTKFCYIYNCATDYNYLIMQDISMAASISGCDWQSYAGHAGRLNVDRASGAGVMRTLTNGAGTPGASNRAFRKADGSCFDRWEKTDLTNWKPSGVDPMAWVSY